MTYARRTREAVDLGCHHQHPIAFVNQRRQCYHPTALIKIKYKPYLYIEKRT